MLKTLIIIILDESTSMSSKQSEVMNGFNQFIADQKKIETDIARLFLVKFNSYVTIVHKGIPLKDVPQLTAQTFMPSGYTALFDGIATGVRLAEQSKAADERVICVIMTDGEENSSKYTTSEMVRQMITGHEAQGDWTFIYIGDNPDRWAKDSGIPTNRSAGYTHRNPMRTMGLMNFAVTNFRSSNDNQSEDLFSEERYSENADSFAPYLNR